MSVEDAWAAGFLDGEGCIVIRSAVDRRWQDGTRGTNGKAYTTFALFVTATQTGADIPPSLKRLQTRYGGGITIHAQRLNRRPSYTWTLTARKAEAFLRAVLPYLTEKHEQAQIALAYRDNAIGIGNLERAAEYAGALKEAKRC